MTYEQAKEDVNVHPRWLTSDKLESGVGFLTHAGDIEEEYWASYFPVPSNPKARLEGVGKYADTLSAIKYPAFFRDVFMYCPKARITEDGIDLDVHGKLSFENGEIHRDLNNKHTMLNKKQINDIKETVIRYAKHRQFITTYSEKGDLNEICKIFNWNSLEKELLSNHFKLSQTKLSVDKLMMFQDYGKETAIFGNSGKEIMKHEFKELLAIKIEEYAKRYGFRDGIEAGLRDNHNYVYNDGTKLYAGYGAEATEEKIMAVARLIMPIHSKTTIKEFEL